MVLYGGKIGNNIGGEKMKKFIKILVCLCLCVVSIGFVACGKESKIDAPASNAPVYSNGGIVVRKGDYVYFANGYNSYEDVTKSDLDKSWSLGGLYVTKQKNGELNYNDKKQLDNMTKLSGKLASFEATELFVSGDYMYFTSINTEETKKGGLQTSHLEVYRINLNSTDCKRVYRSHTDFEKGDERIVTFDYFENDGKVYLLINENGTLKRVVCGSGIGDTETIKSGVKSVKYADKSSIFYTTVEDDIYTLTRYDIVKNQTTSQMTLAKGDTINSIFAVKFDNVYLYLSKDGGDEYLYKISFADLVNRIDNFTKLTETSYTAVYLLNEEIDGILLVSSDKTEILKGGNLVLQNNFNTSATVMMVENGYVYYYADKTISRWNYTTDEAEVIAEDVESILNYHFDILDNYLYYYATTGSNAYLYRVNIAIRSDENVPQVVGRYNDGDAPSEE